MKKATAKASSDVAIVKYWGKRDEKLRLPENGSLSLILEGLDTITTVEFSPKYHDEVIINAIHAENREKTRVIWHLNRIRKLAKLDLPAKVVSQNTFPKGTGLSSSGSGFAALTVAATAALSKELSEKEMSILARQASGTACRCVCGGFVEWLDGNSSDTSYAYTFKPSEYWDIRDVIAVVSQDHKLVSSTKGHQSAQSSPFYQARQARLPKKISEVKQAIQKKDFTKLGTLVEAEALEFHSILLTSDPSYLAWHPGTIEVMQKVRKLRDEGIEAYFTINTGFNVHVLTLPQFQKKVRERIDQLNLVKKTLTASVGERPKIITNHLF